MTIAQKGNFALRTKTFITEHTYTTHDIEIVKYYEPSHCMIIASFDNSKDPYKSGLLSCGLRLIEELEDYDDIKAVKQLAKIGFGIICTEEVESGYKYE